MNDFTKEELMWIRNGLFELLSLEEIHGERSAMIFGLNDKVKEMIANYGKQPCNHLFKSPSKHTVHIYCDLCGEYGSYEHTVPKGNIEL
jgi:hypothetical protein